MTSARSAIPPPRQLLLLGGLATTIVTAVGVATSRAAAPAPCGGVPQITDANGDGHHTSSDVLAAWFSEAAGRLQAVIQVKSGSWAPEHPDAQVPGSAFAMLWSAGGATRYVRASAPLTGPVAYDYGTWTRAVGFASQGATTGVVETGPGGTATIDVPAAVGATAGTRLASPFVLTYDGVNGGTPDWVDHAPGGVAPDDPAVGADYVVGSCPAPSPAGGGTGPSTSAPAPTPAGITAVQLAAPRKLTGGGAATITGRVVPAVGGAVVTLTRRTRTSATLPLTTAADGSFTARIPVNEITTVRAVAGQIGSQTLTIDVQPVVRITTKRVTGGRTQVSGTVKPALPGAALLLRADTPTPTATKAVRTGVGRFTFRLPRTTRHGRYQAVFVPAGDRAERATSNAGVIR